MEGHFNAAAVGMLLQAMDFAAYKHQHQRRKGEKSLPYINHPIQIAKVLWEIGGVRNLDVLTAALLHDTLEDTDTTPEEIICIGGEYVLSLVKEVTDDKSLPQRR